ELAHNQHPASRLAQRQVHATGTIFKNPLFGDLVHEPCAVIHRVIGSDTQQDKHPCLDGTDNGSVHRHGRLRHSLHHGTHQPSRERSMSFTPRAPHNAMARSNSALSISSTAKAPFSPPVASPQRIGRPMSVACAPRASALTTSVPRRMPPSTS